MEDTITEEVNDKTSILLSIKKLIGIPEDYEQFDTDIIIHINSTIASLRQIGVIVPSGFSVSDKTALWSQYITNSNILDSVKSYIYIKVRLIFDPPTNSTVVESLKENLKELEWRIQYSVESEEKEV